MDSRKDSVALIITRIAALVAVLVAASLPLGFGIVAYENLSSSLALKTQVKAAALQKMISSNPDLWIYAENRIQGTIAREPFPLEGELIQVFDRQNGLVVQSGTTASPWVLSRTQTLYDGDRVVGQITMSTSVQAKLYEGAAVLALGVMLGTLVYIVMRVLPLRALRQLTQALIEEKERAETTLRSISDAVSTIDAAGHITQVNPAGLSMLGVRHPDEVKGQSMLDLLEPHDRAAFSELHARVLAGETAQMQFEISGGKDGRRWLETHSVPLQDQGQTVHLAVTRDITDRKLVEEKIHELAFYDQLTGLPNRRLLLDRIGQAMTASARASHHAALLFIDLDRFKKLNDTLGHDMGDLLLVQVAQRLTASIREGDTIARLGGDEFVVMLNNLNTDAAHAAVQAEGVGNKIHRTLAQNYQLQNVSYHCTPSIGVTLFQGFQASAEALMKQADLAMYKSKGSGRNALHFFDPDMEVAVMHRAHIEGDLRLALEEQQFVLYFQPQLDHRCLTGSEVLVRWLHPQRGVVAPSEFIPLAEETGLILPLGQWVLNTACTQLAQWATKPELAHLEIAVNVSAHQFQQRAFVAQVLSVLDQTGANPRKLKLELTESMLVSDVDEIIEKMMALKARGVSFALDDFGTGYSSLAYLKRLPLDQLKIDRSFVHEIHHDKHNAAIAKTIVTLAENLGLTVIAEGVETSTQRDFLEHMGCHACQGYFISRPIPVEEFELFAAGDGVRSV